MASILRHSLYEEFPWFFKNKLREGILTHCALLVTTFHNDIDVSIWNQRNDSNKENLSSYLLCLEIILQKNDVRS